MTKETNKKTTFFKEMLKSINDLDKYEDFAVEMPKVAFKYLFKLVFIFCLITCIFYTYKIVDNLDNVYNEFMSKIPDFSYNEGILKVDSEKPIIFEEYKEILGNIIIDTNGKIEDYDKNKEVGILFLNDRFIVLANSGMSQVVYNYEEVAKEYEVTDFTKQDILDYVENINIISLYGSVFCTIFIYVFIIYFIKILLDVLWLAFLAYLVSRMSRIKLKFAPSFGIATHAITLSVILHLIYIVINLLTGFRIKYFELMYNTISYIYIIVGILMIKTDFIQRQIELAKLAQEQEKVRQEIEKQEDEEKQLPEEDKNENEGEETSKKDEKTKGEQSGEAEAPACKELEEQL